MACSFDLLVSVCLLQTRTFLQRSLEASVKRFTRSEDFSNGGISAADERAGRGPACRLAGESLRDEKKAPPVRAGLGCAFLDGSAISSRTLCHRRRAHADWPFPTRKSSGFRCRPSCCSCRRSTCG